MLNREKFVRIPCTTTMTKKPKKSDIKIDKSCRILHHSHKHIHIYFSQKINSLLNI